MEQKVIIDADPGIGDALAILAALLDPQLDVLAVTATAGCVPARQATQNVQAIIELLDPPKWPRLGEADTELSRFIEDLHFATASVADLNGPGGLGNCTFSGADLHNRRESTKLMIDVVRSYPDEVTLLTLGPLTNVEVACERAPDFMDLLGRLVCLGGSIAAGGDVTAAAEFNLYAHPAAARHILLSPATKTLVPLDVSNQVIFTFEHYNRLPGEESGPVGRLLAQLLPFTLRAHHQHLGQEGVRLQEVVALAALSQPQLFESEPMALDVETRGELTRGMTIVDRRDVKQWQTNIEVLTAVDPQGVLDYFLRTLNR